MYITICIFVFVQHYWQLLVLLHVQWSVCPIDVTSENVSMGSVKPTTIAAMMTTTMKLSPFSEVAPSRKHVYCKPGCWSLVLPLVTWESTSCLLCYKYCHAYGVKKRTANGNGEQWYQDCYNIGQFS